MLLRFTLKVSFRLSFSLVNKLIMSSVTCS